MAMRWYSLGWIALTAACREAPKPPPGPPPTAGGFSPAVAETPAPVADTTPALDTLIGRCAVVFGTPSAEQQEVIAALRAAYRLEDVLLFQHGTVDSISREEVFAHYRQGFGEQLAQQLTDYSWELSRLRATERALVVPDSVGVIELKRDRALVGWIPPTMFRMQWGAPRCSVDRMIREDGRWIIQAHEP